MNLGPTTSYAAIDPLFKKPAFPLFPGRRPRHVGTGSEPQGADALPASLHEEDKLVLFGADGAELCWSMHNIGACGTDKEDAYNMFLWTAWSTTGDDVTKPNR